MPKHANDKGRTDRRIDEHASQASALLAARAQRVKADSDATTGADAQPTPERSRQRPEEGPHLREEYPHTTRGFLKRNAVYIASVAVVAVIVAVGLVILGVVRPGVTGLEGSRGDSASYSSPYDWTKLDRTDGRYRYIVDGQVKSRLGVDVSENQHDIDWNAVAADGIDYAIVRVGYRGATEGELYLDPRYRANIEGARNAGLAVGVYFFSQAATVAEAVEEADYVIAQLGGMKLEYPVAFDSEQVALASGVSRTTGVGNEEMTAIAEAFCKRVEQAGYKSAVYGNASDLSRYDLAVLEQNSIWWAEYNTPTPSAGIDIDYWQYTNAGEVAGISAAVYINLDLTGVLYV